MKNTLNGAKHGEKTEKQPVRQKSRIRLEIRDLEREMEYNGEKVIPLNLSHEDFYLWIRQFLVVGFGEEERTDLVEAALNKVGGTKPKFVGQDDEHPVILAEEKGA